MVTKRGISMLITIFLAMLSWSGKRDSNSRPQPWQGCALPLSYSRTSRWRILRMRMMSVNRDITFFLNHLNLKQISILELYLSFRAICTEG